MTSCRYPVLLALALLALASGTPGGTRGLQPEVHATAAIEAAHLYGLDPVELVALAWEESRFRSDLVSVRGACGATQVNPKFVRGIDCDDLRDVRTAYLIGALVWTRWRLHCPSDEPLECYNGGNAPGRAARQYVARIKRNARWLRAWMDAAAFCRGGR